jgi:hypothetical protein
LDAERKPRDFTEDECFEEVDRFYTIFFTSPRKCNVCAAVVHMADDGLLIRACLIMVMRVDPPVHRPDIEEEIRRLLLGLCIARELDDLAFDYLMRRPETIDDEDFKDMQGDNRLHCESELDRFGHFYQRAGAAELQDAVKRFANKDAAGGRSCTMHRAGIAVVQMNDVLSSLVVTVRSLVQGRIGCPVILEHQDPL